MCKVIMLLLIALFCASVQAQLIVNTTEGPVEGLKNVGYIAFYGIPYAGRVDGPNRFKAAPPPAMRSDVFLANDNKTECIHPINGFIVGIENCLTANIFTSNLTTSSRPVLIWLDAEKYTEPPTFGVRSFHNYVEQGIVVVNLNFRLSIFGFLCLGVEQAPGNAGIKDIIQGLEWINRNIKGFGGDPENVLLMGHESAAALVDIVTMVPRANNLVHKAITLSGSALAPWAVAYNPVEYAKAVGEVLGYSTTSQSDLAKQFASTNVRSFPRALNHFTFFNNTPLFAPCIENKNVSFNDSVLTDTPINILRAGNYSHIPYIAVHASNEGTILSQGLLNDWIPELERNFSKFLPADLDFSNNVAASEAESVIWSHYFGNRGNVINVLDFEKYQGDTLLLVPVIRGARERAATSRFNVRLMEFGHMITATTSEMINTTTTETLGHGVIKNYLFGSKYIHVEVVVMESLVSRIIAFAKNGVPSGPTSDPQIWSPFSPDSTSYLTYSLYRHNGVPSSREELLFNPRRDIMNLWDTVYLINSRHLNAVPSSAGHLGAFIFVVLLCFVGSRFV